MKRYTLLFVLFALLGCAREPAVLPPPPVPPPYDAGLRDGSVVFWKGGPNVEPMIRNTGSDLTHAAIILYVGTEPYVYEAVPPQVWKVPLAKYRTLMAEKTRECRKPMCWLVMQPTNPYTAKQLAAMKAHAESQLGRPYMLRGWWLGHEARGIFCSELVGDILTTSGIVKAGGVHESPGSLHAKLVPFYGELSTP